jgi:hypothetical protein
MTLADEAQRYLAVVEFFRAEGCEPRLRKGHLGGTPSTEDPSQCVGAV